MSCKYRGQTLHGQVDMKRSGTAGHTRLRR